MIGSNSRLDTVQAAILNVNIKYIDEFAKRRKQLAEQYDQMLKAFPEIIVPKKHSLSTHVYHQYTIQVLNGRRDEMKRYLAEKGIPSMIYYPIPVHEQEAYKWMARRSSGLNVSEHLCAEVLSLPVHPELTDETQSFIIEAIGSFVVK